MQTGTGQVRAARQHEWAEPLEAGLRYTLREAISQSLGYDLSARSGGRPWQYTVDVHLDQLHGTMGGTALLDASYRIKPSVGGSVDYRFSRSAPLPREGYPGLVEAEIALTRQLAQAIAASLGEPQSERAGP